MSRQFYDKLVRDKIPDLIAASGGKSHFELLGQDAFAVALKEKLIEEAREVQTAEETSLHTELADLQEVIDALLRYYGITREEVETVQKQRRIERGAFDRQIRLLWVE